MDAIKIVTNSNDVLLLNKDLIKKDGLIYSSVYKQLLYVYEYNVLHETIDKDGYFKYSLEFLAKMFKIDFEDIFEAVVKLKTDNLIDFFYSIDLKNQLTTLLIKIQTPNSKTLNFDEI